jgi:hypothetical protein
MPGSRVALSSTDLGGRSRAAGRFRTVGRFGLTEFITLNPPSILLTAILPRVLVQALFFTILGSVLGGSAGRSFAYVGSVALIIGVVCTDVGEVPMADKWSGVFTRIRTGTMSPFAVILLRSWPYAVAATGMAAVVIVAVGPLTGQAGTVPALLTWLPVYLLMAGTTTTATIAATLLAVGRRADVLATNTLSFGILLAGGVFLPPGRVPLIDAVGAVLPVRHGLLAVRAGLAGEPWLGQMLLEVVVGLGWTAAGWVIMVAQVRRARRLGIDDFA